MKILTAEQIRALDQFTIENEPISPHELMERAAEACFDELLALSTPHYSTVYICGKGNNGGDGLALARIHGDEYGLVTVIIIEHKERGSHTFAQNLYLLGEQGIADVIHVSHIDEFPEIQADAVIVDAILGNGLSKPLDGLIADVAKRINTLDNVVVSIDMPTGLFAEDNTLNDLSAVVKADYTFTIHAPKLSLLLPDTGKFAGNVSVINIELLADQMGVASSYEYVEAQDLQKLYKPRQKFSHKGTFGHALLISGSKGKMGATQLAASACLRSGAGLVTAHVPACGLDIMQVGVKEAMCSVDSNADYVIDLPNLDVFTAVGMGPAIGTEKDTANVLKRLIQDARVPMVLDADALNILSENKTWLSFLPKGTILTPHPKEFERLTGSWNDSLERLKTQVEFSRKYGVVVVLKGAHTSTSTPSGQVFFNSTGNAGMATAGSGDVLTGIILGLLAQGYSSETAAIIGVFVHGLAGDIAVQEQSQESLIASDIIHSLKDAISEMNDDLGRF